MTPIEHPWTDWQEQDLTQLFAWKWKENTPKEIKEQYEEWQKHYNKKMKNKE